MSGRDYYQVLGVSRDASTADIRAAFVHLVRLHHPDTSNAGVPRWRLRDVQQAYHCLSNHVARSAHDRALAEDERYHLARARRVRHRLRRYDHRHPQVSQVRRSMGWPSLLVFVVIAGIAAAIVHALD